MYYDLGFSDWVFEIEQTEGRQITNRLRDVWQNYSQAKNKLALVMKHIDNIYDKRTESIKKLV